MRGEPAQDIFLEDTGKATCSNPDHRIFNQQPRTAIVCRIVRIGDSAGCERPDNCRIVGLIALIVALGNHGIADRVPNPSFRAGSSIKIAWILFQQRCQHSAIDKRTYENVAVSCAETSRIACRTLPVPTPSICRLVNSRKGGHAHDGNGIRNRLPGKDELLLWSERGGIGEIVDIEIWNDAEHPLLLLLLNLYLRYFGFRKPDPHFRSGGRNRQHDLRHNVSLSRIQDPRDDFGLESWRRNCELERSRNDIGKGEFPVIAGEYLLFWVLVSMRKFHMSANRQGSGLINYCSGNAPCQLLIRLFRASGFACSLGGWNLLRR